MLKKRIKYQDFNGNDIEEDYYFNLTQSELIKLQASIPGGLEQMLRNIIDTKDGNKIIEMFNMILRISYGEKSPDGKRFVKNDEIFQAFEQTAAYDTLYMELVTDANKAAAFIKGILPSEIQEASNIKTLAQ